jgi:hypothetical protein
MVGRQTARTRPRIQASAPVVGRGAGGQLESGSAARAAQKGADMSLKSRVMMRVAKKKPHLLLIPLVPLGLTVSAFVMSLVALRKATRLSSPAPAAG